MKLELTTKQFRRLLDMAYIYGLYWQLDLEFHPG